MYSHYFITEFNGMKQDNRSDQLSNLQTQSVSMRTSTSTGAGAGAGAGDRNRKCCLQPPFHSGLLEGTQGGKKG